MPALDFERWVVGGASKPDVPAKATLYRWWTDGCPHCEKTLPAVEALRKQYGDRGLRVVAVYHPKPVRDVSDADVRAAAQRMGYGGAVALDQDWSELKKFYLDTGDRPATSASFLVDADGVIRLVHPGPRFYPSGDSARAKEDADYRRIDAAIRGLVGD
jgi:thiol-disulfide isomerase/thioredoxin